MVSGPLPLPESAFKNWKALAREFQRAMAVVASDDMPLAVKQSHALMIGHIRRILHPSRINHSALLWEDTEQANPDYAKALYLSPRISSIFVWSAPNTRTDK